jgi:hypothetical protein
MTKLVNAIKSILMHTPASWVCLPVYRQYQLCEWVRAGKPIPPPVKFKQQIVKEYAKRFRLRIFVETGTYMGEMVNAVKNRFDQIYSIELGLELYENTKRRFADKKNITIIHGDSGEVLDEVLGHVNQPCLFWLDSHYSGGITAKGEVETPIRRELSHIFNHSIASHHVILIDDARLFIGEHDWPTIEELRNMSSSAGFDAFKVKHDVIRIHKLASPSK